MRYYDKYRRVSIPFKRESVFKGKTTPFGIRETSCVSIPFKRESVFKEDGVVGPKTRAKLLVSIPFKRESVFKVLAAFLRIVLGVAKFQFPSNGKVYSKPSASSPELSLYICFNSLQTGKCIQRFRSCLFRGRKSRVSIPFKRESVFKERC